MIICIKQVEKINILCTVFCILKKEQIEEKTIIYIPINKKTRKERVKKVIEKLSRYLKQNNIRNVVLEKKLMENEIVKHTLYNNNINIQEGSKLSQFLVYPVIQKILKYKNSKIETGEITLLVNSNNDIAIENIVLIAKNVKRLNIITSNTQKFKKIVEYLYNELGILIKLSSNIKTNLSSSDIIVNIDFTEEAINKLEIPNNAILVNVPQNINIKSKRFAGINVKGWEIEMPVKYKMDGFDDKTIYEANIYKKPNTKVFEQIENDKIKIKKLIGVNGIINKKEFIRNLQNST